MTALAAGDGCVDSHSTITAAVLFPFGTGSVNGVAVSLSLGILINLFTTLVTMRVAFDSIFRRFEIKRLSI
jgi:preprotein translocase subunit SecD